MGDCSSNKKIRNLKVNFLCVFLIPCDPCRIQTCNPHIRSVVLYSVELMDRYHVPFYRGKIIFVPPEVAFIPASNEIGDKGTAFF